MYMKINPIESDLSKFVRDNYNGWIERIEPAQGMSPGIPDLIVMTDCGLVFVELKIASIIDGILWSNEIRPSQISWHTNYYQQNRRRGTLTAFLFGVWSNGSWKLFARAGGACMAFSEGIPADTLTPICNITEDLENFCADNLN